jgi:hypothetical protein
MLCDEVSDSCNVPMDTLCNDSNPLTTDICVGIGGNPNGCTFS